MLLPGAKFEAVIPTEAYLPLLPPFVPVRNYFLATYRHKCNERVDAAITLLIHIREVLGSILAQDISYLAFAVLLGFGGKGQNSISIKRRRFPSKSSPILL